MDEKSESELMFALCFGMGMLILTIPMSFMDIGPFQNVARLRRENVELRRINAELAESLAKANLNRNE